MKLLVVPGYVLLSPYRQYVHSPVELSDFGYLTICRHDIEISLPPEFDEKLAELAILRQSLAQLEARHAEQAAAINHRIANLLAIGNSE